MSNNLKLNIELLELDVGWFDFYIKQGNIKIFVSASAYLGEDSMRKLLQAFLKLLRGHSSVEWVRWYDEPGSRLWKVMIEDTVISIADMNIDIPSDDLILKDEQYFESMHFTTDLKMIFKPKELIKMFLDFFSLLEEDKGIQHYEEHWFEYPRKELDALAEVFRELT